MIPILFSESTTTFTTNGIGRLSECISCVCREVLNGAYELELEYPITGKRFNDITHSKIIGVIPYDGCTNIQAFRIYDITKPLNGKIKIYCEHISYQTNWIPVKPFSASSLSDCLKKLKTNSIENNPFTFTTDKTVTTGIGFTEPKQLRNILAGEEGSVLDTYRGEFEWDNWTIKLLNNRGSDNHVTLRYGKNITDIEQDETIDTTYTGIVPYWFGSEEKEDVTEEMLITLPEYVVESTYASLYPFKRTQVMDFTDQFDGPPSIEELRNFTKSYINRNDIGKPNISINVDFVALWQTKEYQNYAPIERVKLGDTVTIIFEKLNISATAKVIEYEYDVLRERYNSVQIGDAKSTLASTLTGAIAETNDSIEAVKTEAKRVAKNATEWLTRGDGYLVLVKGSDGSFRELLAMDTPSTKTAKQVLRLNQYGLGFSKTGVDGPFYQAWTLDGVLTVGGTDTALIEVLDSTNRNIFSIDSNGLTINSLTHGRKIFTIDNQFGGITVYSYDSSYRANRLFIDGDGIEFYDVFSSEPTQYWHMGGRMQIGNYFNVAPDGTMTATNGKFSGDITASTINLKDNFIATSAGAVTAKNITITGGSLDIGDNFTVTKQGVLTATNGNFSGKITASTININNNFTVTDEGKVSIKSGSLNINSNFIVLDDGTVTIKKGSLSIGNKFTVTIDGILTAVDGNFKGEITSSSININDKFIVTKQGAVTAKEIDITGGSLTIGENFSVTKNGVLTAKSGTFSGNITGSTITGSTITTKGTGSEEQFLKLSEGKMTGGWGSTTYGGIDFAHEITDKDSGTTYHALKTYGDAILEAGVVYSSKRKSEQDNFLRTYTGNITYVYDVDFDGPSDTPEVYYGKLVVVNGRIADGDFS